MSVGERIRLARTARELSLSQVAERAGVSIATLSRIERDRQALDLGLFLTLSSILKTSPQELIGDEAGHNVDPLALRIARLKHADRVQLWRDLTAQRNGNRAKDRRNIDDQVEELLAQVDFVRGEMQSVRARLRKR